MVPKGPGAVEFMGNVIERAMALAASGEHTSIRSIRYELHREGFSHRELSALSGRELQRQLRALILAQSALAARKLDDPPSAE